jgi:hypothetical protein
VLTDWGNIATVMGAAFVGIVAILAMVVYLERWLGGSEPSSLAASHAQLRTRRILRTRRARRASRTRPAGEPLQLDELSELDSTPALVAARRRRFAGTRLVRRRHR